MGIDLGLKLGLKIIPLYAGLLALLYIFLSFQVIKWRRVTKTGIGWGDSVDLKRSVRVHANYSEYVPLALILCAFLELSISQELVIHLLGGSLLLGRILHAVGLSGNAGTSYGRFIGTLLTYMVLLAAGVGNIVAFFS